MTAFFVSPAEDWSVPVCFVCLRTPEEILAYTPFAHDAGLTNTEYVIREEGTLNPLNGHFACDACYCDIGMPSGPHGSRWVAP
jgi:hypothetical protein